MKKFIRYIALFIPIFVWGALWVNPARSETVSSLGEPSGYVNDFAGVLSSSDESRLKSICEDLVAANTTEIAIVTIHTTSGRPIKEFTVELFNTWGIGDAYANNGLLILAAIDDRDYWVSTGYGIEHIITDSLAVRIMDNEAVPEFRKGSYGRGLIRAATQFAEVLRGEEYKSGVSFNGWMIAVPVGLAAILIFLITLAVRIKCPRCGSKVKLTDDKEVLTADYSHSGIRKKDYVCTVCHHQFSKMQAIPMLVYSAGSGKSSGWSSGSSGGWSGGGGSSFGGFSGGSSGGGGGGGSW